MTKREFERQLITSLAITALITALQIALYFSHRNGWLTLACVTWIWYVELKDYNILSLRQHCDDLHAQLEAKEAA